MDSKQKFVKVASHNEFVKVASDNEFVKVDINMLRWTQTIKLRWPLIMNLLRWTQICQGGL